ncbi:MAG: histidine kinase [Zoogloeaceae bacterium]|jgi:two-component system sensor histidine kinase AlgZ|nr:histidine kinase [Zoogloeaceae bacterium]
MSSIRQKTGHPLPDWRNLGVLLRALLGVNALMLVLALEQAQSLAHWFAVFIAYATWVEPLLLFNLAFLACNRNLLWRYPLKVGQALVLLAVALSTALFWDAWHYLGLVESGYALLRAVLLAVGSAGLMLFYFELRARALSPRVEEARLQALNARIRPHFLFNSLNTVLALIRSDPRRAETALEELADLFRALLREPRELVPLSDEIALGRQYLDLEKLRLGERLNVQWDVRAVPLETLVPPLMLQPLLENAVHHGMESAPNGGEIRVFLNMKGEMLTIIITNPLGQPTGREKSRGNHMALGNIRARLALYYDMEATLEHGPKNNAFYQVTIELPCRFRKPPPL